MDDEIEDVNEDDSWMHSFKSPIHRGFNPVDGIVKTLKDEHNLAFPEDKEIERLAKRLDEYETSRDVYENFEKYHADKTIIKELDLVLKALKRLSDFANSDVSRIVHLIWLSSRIPTRART